MFLIDEEAKRREDEERRKPVVVSPRPAVLPGILPIIPQHGGDVVMPIVCEEVDPKDGG